MPSGAAAAAVPSAAARSRPQPSPANRKSLNEVITKDAKSFPGVFTVHRIDDKVYFEIPKDGFDRLMLWQSEVVKGPGRHQPGAASRLAAITSAGERRGNKVYLWQVSFAKRGDGKAIQSAVDSANLDTSSSASRRGRGQGPLHRHQRHAVVSVRCRRSVQSRGPSVPLALVVRVRASTSRVFLPRRDQGIPNKYRSPFALDLPGRRWCRRPGPWPRTNRPEGGGAARSHTALIHFSLVAMPERPMMGHPSTRGWVTSPSDLRTMPRRRPGWISNSTSRASAWRKKDPAAEVSEPVQPIVFYVSREVPEKWRPYLMKGIEDWKPAFEKAGFKNAIIAKEAPDPRQGPHLGPGRRPLLGDSLGGRAGGRTRWGHTCMTRAPARSSPRTSSFCTTS